MTEAKPVDVQQEQNRAELGEPALDVEHDRDTFLPRPSDSPNDPLNWSIYLKVKYLFEIRGFDFANTHFRELF